MNLKNNKNIGLILILLLQWSCATQHEHEITKSTVKKPLNIVKNEGRFPDFALQTIKKKEGRRPASANMVIPKDRTRKLSELYFLSLYQQYQYFNQLVGHANERLICPSFHNQLLDYEEHEMNIGLIKGDTVVKGHPLVTTGSAYKSFINYNEINKREIEELCLTAESDGLYRFINLAKYYQNQNKIREKIDPLVAYMKIPVVANIYFLNDFRSSRKRINLSPIEGQLLVQMNALLVVDYLYSVIGSTYTVERYTYNKRDK